MEVVLVFGDAGICDRSDMENLSRKRFSAFESLDRHLASIGKGEGKFTVVGFEVFVDDCNARDIPDYAKSYLKGEAFMDYAKIG